MKTDRRSFVATCLALLGLGRLAPNQAGVILQAARQTGKIGPQIPLVYEQFVSALEANGIRTTREHTTLLRAYEEALVADHVIPWRIVRPTV